MLVAMCHKSFGFPIFESVLRVHRQSKETTSEFFFAEKVFNFQNCLLKKFGKMKIDFVCRSRLFLWWCFIFSSTTTYVRSSRSRPTEDFSPLVDFDRFQFKQTPLGFLSQLNFHISSRPESHNCLSNEQKPDNISHEFQDDQNDENDDQKEKEIDFGEAIEKKNETVFESWDDLTNTFSTFTTNVSESNNSDFFFADDEFVVSKRNVMNGMEENESSHEFPCSCLKSATSLGKLLPIQCGRFILSLFLLFPMFTIKNCFFFRSRLTQTQPSS